MKYVIKKTSQHILYLVYHYTMYINVDYSVQVQFLP